MALKPEGGAVNVPAGKYLIGTVELKSNVTLNLEKDSIIKVSQNAVDILKGTYDHMRTSVLTADHATNIGITDGGEINVQGSVWWQDNRWISGRPNRIIMPIHCDGVILKDFTLRNVNGWTCCSNILIDGVTVRGCSRN